MEEVNALFYPKISNEVLIDLQKKQIIVNDQYLSLDNGVYLNEGQHFGIEVVDEVGKRTLYPTQESVVGVCVLAGNEYDGKIAAYENGKYQPWIFTKEGMFLQPAIFLSISRKDVDYATEHYNVSREMIPTINEYAYQETKVRLR